MNKLSVVLIVKNEAANIEECVKSAEIADEIVVLDTGSSDDTAKIAERLGCKVYHLDKWDGFGNAKRKAVALATNDWVLSLDADERLSKELSEKIKAILVDPKYCAYRIKFRSFYLGREIKHSGWANEYHKRLFNTQFVQYNDNYVHESLKVKGESSTIEEPILHYSYDSLSTHLRKIDLYSELGAKQLSGKKSSVCGALARSFLRFVKSYIIQLGFLDGREGLILAYMSSVSTAMKYLKISIKK